MKKTKKIKKIEKRRNGGRHPLRKKQNGEKLQSKTPKIHFGDNELHGDPDQIQH